MIEIEEGPELDKAVDEAIMAEVLPSPVRWSSEINCIKMLTDWLKKYHKQVAIHLSSNFLDNEAMSPVVLCQSKDESHKYQAKTINLALCKAVLFTSGRLKNAQG